jgi:hypothetical protein
VPSSAFYDGESSGLEISRVSNVGARMTFMLGDPSTEPVGDPVVLDACTTCTGP